MPYYSYSWQVEEKINRRFHCLTPPTRKTHQLNYLFACPVLTLHYRSEPRFEYSLGILGVLLVKFINITPREPVVCNSQVLLNHFGVSLYSGWWSYSAL